jgi:hypothetical protein
VITKPSAARKTGHTVAKKNRTPKSCPCNLADLYVESLRQPQTSAVTRKRNRRQEIASDRHWLLYLDGQTSRPVSASPKRSLGHILVGSTVERRAPRPTARQTLGS